MNTKLVDNYITETAGKFERVENDALRVRMPQQAVDIVKEWSEQVYNLREGKRLWREDDTNSIHHHVMGRLGEIAACIVFSKSEYFPGILTPDWAFYKDGYNYRAPDLCGIFHVKTAASTLGEDLSWIAEREDKIILGEVAEPIIMVKSHGYAIMDVMGIWMPKQIMYSWGQPLSQKLAETKYAVYFRDLQAIPRWTPCK